MSQNLMQRLRDLASASDTPEGLTRLFLSPAHATAAAMVAGWMREAGLAVHVDAIGTVVGQSAVPGPKLLIGSHIDTVPDAGRYDGNFGVLAAIAAMHRLQDAGEVLPYGVEILAFGDEEGVRFSQTLSGSRAVAGIFDETALAGVDADGISMAEALRDFGGDPDAVTTVARRRDEVLGYVEWHIEQGPVLEAKNLAVGVVTAINGAARFAVTVTGQAGHAGTVPMAMRHDALAAASEMVLAVERIAGTTLDLVATVGAVAVHPGAPNSVPGRVNFSLDIRAPDDAVRHAAMAVLGQNFQVIAERRAVILAMQQTHEAAATPCVGWLQAQLAAAVSAEGIAPWHLPSGAGHDAMAMAALCPVGMLFVRCEGGISHTPEESITEADAETAVDVLARFLRDFKPE